jgi:Fe-S-cluster containining protein
VSDIHHRRTDPCAHCGACCRSFVVPLSGDDVWSISTRLRLPPARFVVLSRQREPAWDGFRLRRYAETYSLVLGKQGVFEATAWCIFLTSLQDGTTQCRIYDERPAVCAAYPMAVHGGSVVYRPDALCPPNAWPPGEPSRATWLAAQRRITMQSDIYSEVVQHWNKLIEEAPSGVCFVPAAYLTYIIDVYNNLAELKRSIGVAQVTEIATRWPVRVAMDRACPVVDTHMRDEYVALVRNRIKAYYPRFDRSWITLAD